MSWLRIWSANINLDEEGWSVEMQIPFSQLRFKESNKITWSVNFSRQIKRNNEPSYFVLIPKNESGFV
jgi:hypothetical protein